MSVSTQAYWEKTKNYTLEINVNSQKDMNPQELVEFTWEGKRKDERVHFLTPPPPPLEWTDIYPNER